MTQLLKNFRFVIGIIDRSHYQSHGGGTKLHKCRECKTQKYSGFLMVQTLNLFINIDEANIDNHLLLKWIALVENFLPLAPTDLEYTLEELISIHFASFHGFALHKNEH